MLHKFKLVQTAPNRWQTFIDGKRVMGVTSVDFSAAMNTLPKVTITLNAGEVEIDADGGVIVETSSADGDGVHRSFAKVA